MKLPRTRVNLEAKALDPDPEATRRACVELGASEAGLLRQRDTYFETRSGRLKLREDLGAATAELIAYERPTVDGIRVSRYRRVAVAAPAETLELLAAALGVSGVVEKERRLFLYRNVRIHLDEVEHLGTFVELEAVLASRVDRRERDARTCHGSAAMTTARRHGCADLCTSGETAGRQRRSSGPRWPAAAKRTPSGMRGRNLASGFT